jgi:signal transduction histidine kinase
LLDVLLALALAVLTLPVSAAAIWGSSWSSALQVMGVAALALAHACVALRRVATRFAFGVGGAVMVLLVALPSLDVADGVEAFAPICLPSVLVFPVLLYSVAAWSSPQTSLTALAASGVGCMLVVARLWGADYLTVAQPGLTDQGAPVRSWQLFLAIGVFTLVMVPWGLGRYRRLRTQYVLELEGRARREEQDRLDNARRAAKEERTRIAREMHDVVSHTLSVMVSQAEGGRMLARQDPAVTLPVLETVARTGQEAMRDMRCLLHALDEDDPTGVDSPQPGLDDLPALIARVRQSGLHVGFSERGCRLWVSGAAELAAYRVTQEALTNVLKHAGADASAYVCLDWRHGTLYLTVRNDRGRPRMDTTSGGRGLTGMTQRVAVLGGTLTAEPVDRGGFTLTAAIPALTGVRP